MVRIEKIKFFSNFNNLERIDVGFDKCDKYSFTINNKKYVLKTFDDGNYESKKREVEILNKLQGNDLLIPRVIAFDKADGGYYYILSWIEGKTIKESKPQLSDSDLYNIGKKVGSMISTIHKTDTYNIDLSNNIEKILNRLDKYKNYCFNMENEDKVINFVKENISCLRLQPITIIHGDLTEDNIVVDNDKVGFIDFGSANINYSYYDFHQVQMYNRFFSVPFSVGIIDSYLNQTSVSNHFFEILKVYSAYLSLHKIVWATKLHRNDLVDEMKKRYLTTYSDYNGFEADIPFWYKSFDRQKVKKI